jgi:hypothetical protein
MSIDVKSLGSLCLAPYSFSQPAAVGTGFVIAVGEVTLLITNYHVVSGRHPDTGKQLDKATAIPDRVLIPLLKRQGPPLCWRPQVQMLIVDGVPQWVEHPRFGYKFDVVALPLAVPPDSQVFPYEPGTGHDLALHPGSDVAIIGFPEGMTGPGLTPIWKKGSIASELDLSIGTNNFFWIDSNTRRGMSGAPVIARRFGGALMQNGSYGVGAEIYDRNLGVYAGRAFEAPDMTLGRVWSWEGVQEVVDLAVSRVRRGIALPVVCNIGHFSCGGSTMIKINPFVGIDVLATNPAGQVEQRRVFLHEVLRDFVLADDRFGLDLEQLRISAAINASIDAAIAEKGDIKLNDKQYSLIREVIEKPSRPYNATVGRQILPLLDHVLSAGKSGAQA